LKIKEPDYLFPIIGGIITILGLILPLGYDTYGTDSNFGSFFWIIFHNIEINDFITNLLIYLMIPLLSILIINYTAWTFKIISDVKKKKINKKKFETEMFLLSIILFLLGIYLIMIAGNAYLIERYDHLTSSWWLPASMWGPYLPSFGFYCLIFGPIIIRFGTFYNTVDTEEEKKKVITKTFIVLFLLLFFIWFFWGSYPGLDIYLAFLTIPIFLDSWIYLFPDKKKKKPHRADMSFRIRKKIMVKKNLKNIIKFLYDSKNLKIKLTSKFQ